MANVLFTRKNASEIPNVPIIDGQLIFDTSGNGKMYLDVGDERLEMGGALTVDATLSKTSTNPIQNKAIAGVMLDNLSDISNVTSKGFLPDALAIKELNSSLNSFYKITECGVLEIPDIPSGTNGSRIVTFEKTYENTPIVMVSVISSNSTNVIATCDNLSKTNVKVFARNNFSSAITAKVAYAVIEI